MESLLFFGGVSFALAAAALLITVFVMRRQPRAQARRGQYATRAIAQSELEPQPVIEPLRSISDPALDPNATVVVNLNRQAAGSLHGTSANVAGRVIPIDAYGVYIGRDPKLSQIVIESKQVSKRHLWVGVKDGVAVAIDQGSTNGTYVNSANVSVNEVRLEPGDTIVLANEAATFVYRA